jgi:hypothetical protein
MIHPPLHLNVMIIYFEAIKENVDISPGYLSYVYDS